MLQRLSPHNLADIIHGAEERVLYAAPGIHHEVASALCNQAIQPDAPEIDIYTDVRESAVRLGYGTIEDVEMVRAKGLSVNHAPGVRIGIVLADMDGWVFNLPALMVEDANLPRQWPNAVQLTIDQIVELQQSFSNCAKGDDRSSEADPEAENDQSGIIFDAKPVSDHEVEAITRRLEESPPEPFDLSRKLKVYQQKIQFVELEFKGGAVSQHRIKLPRKLKNLLAKNEDVRNRLQASYKLVEKGVIRIERELAEKVEALRRNYLANIPRIGSVLLIAHKRRFLEELTVIEDEINSKREALKSEVKAQVESACERLEDELVPLIVGEPPSDLRNKVTSTVDDDAARRYVRRNLEGEVNRARRRVEDMELKYLFKDVTIEMLRNPEFQEKIREALPYENWDELVDEWSAVSSRGGLSGKQKLDGM